MIPLQNSLFNSVSGGSCAFNNSLFYFFGSSLMNDLVFLSSAARLDLNNLSIGWQNVTITGCSQHLLPRNSFGYSLGNYGFYIFGGFTQENLTNSALNLTLNTWNSEIQCDCLFEDNLSPRRRSGASMVYISGGFYLFGGQDQGVLLNDLWFYQLNNTS